MVWCGLSSNELLAPYFSDETVTGSTHRQIFVDYAWPQLQCKRLYFQHNGAAPHYALIEEKRLDEEFPGRWIVRHGPFDWPAPSPDLTPCEFFLWIYLKDIVFKEPCISLIQLQDRIQEACAGITKVTCRKVCHSVAQRLRDCLEKDGQFLSSQFFYIMNTSNCSTIT